MEQEITLPVEGIGALSATFVHESIQIRLHERPLNKWIDRPLVI